MNLYDTYTMKRGAILVDVCGYTGEEDFYAMHKIIDEVIKPDDSDSALTPCVSAATLIKTASLSVPAAKVLTTA